MVNGIGQGGGLGRAAIDAALARMQGKAAKLGAEVAQEHAAGPDFADAVKHGIADLDQQARIAEELPLEALQGNVDFHEVAATLKQTELAFDFAMQVRNKFVDAYREVMRMSV
jgi:flagellar hook-basal body complex protein FliE